MLSRKQAIIGWITFSVLRSIVRRKMRGLSPAGRGGGMFRRESSGKEATVIAVARPIVTRAATDAEFHDAIRQAYSTGRKLSVLVRGRSPHDAARELGRDRKLQDEIESSAQLLQTAVARVVGQEDQRRRRGRGGLVAMLAAGAAVVALAPLVVRKLRSDFS